MRDKFENMKSSTEEMATADHLEATTEKFDERYYVASQWQLMWRKLRKHKLALAAGGVLFTFYFVALFAEFFAPYTAQKRFPAHVFCPAQQIHIFDEGTLRWPFVYGIERVIDPNTFQRHYYEDRDVRHRVRLFTRGEE